MATVQFSKLWRHVESSTRRSDTQRCGSSGILFERRQSPGDRISDWILTRSSGALWTKNKGQSREPAIYEFDPARFVDIDGDGFWEYCDTLGKCRSPLVYICNWLDQGYDKRDYSDFLDDVYRTGKGKDAKPWGRGGIQIISPGKDRRYGSGGYYNIEDESWWKSSPNRQADRDNYTSFCAGPLDGTLR